MIRVVSDTATGKGDLFTERMKDLVHALGFETIRTNVHKSGREIDLLSRHRLENRYALFECKAQTDKVGGADINKFIGVLDAERRSYGNVTGYFLSVSGFTETAKEQEERLGGDRCILVDQSRIEQELVTSHVMVGRSVALIRAADSRDMDEWRIDENAEVLATDHGWLWMVYYTEFDTRVAYTLVHADGHALGFSTVEAIANAIEASGIDLPFRGKHAGEYVSADTRRLYVEYLKREFGYITHEGLPADPHVSATLELDKVYVPSQLENRPVEAELDYQFADMSPSASVPVLSYSLGEAMAISRHMAVLAGPGAGKSTLVKRLALAYADDADDLIDEIDLPREALTPVIIRCRDLTGGQVSLFDLIKQIPHQAAIPDAEQRFTQLVTSALRSGDALVLVDGLDEVAAPAARIAFARNLRHFMSVYPLARYIVTSREPGFRAVASALAEHCRIWHLSDLTNDAIRNLVRAWQDLVPRRHASPTQSPNELAERILRTDRLRRLASNPLMLTTLLLVERWVGDLPRRRSVLYGKAIEVLLITWNIEGHDPLDIDEVLPQLAYIAYAMTSDGSQRISQRQLVEWLRQARLDMPDILAYGTMGPTELLQNVELRSSLIVQAGFTQERGHLQPAFEFKHLTFQEYLTALAIVEGWNPSGKGDGPATLLRPHYESETWAEVIPLAAVLAGRDGSPIVAGLCDRLEEIHARGEPDDEDDCAEPDDQDYWWAPLHLVIAVIAGCLIDDASIHPAVAERALRLLIEDDFSASLGSSIPALLETKFAEMLETLVSEQCSLPDQAYAREYGAAVGEILVWQFLQVPPDSRPTLEEHLRSKLRSSQALDRVSALGALVSQAYRLFGGGFESLGDKLPDLEVRVAIESLIDEVIEVLEKDPTDRVELVTAIWAVNWMLAGVQATDVARQTLFERARFLLSQPIIAHNTDLCYWAIWRAGDVPRGRLKVDLTSDEKNFISSILSGARNPESHRQQYAVALAYHGRAVADAELLEYLSNVVSSNTRSAFLDTVQVSLQSAAE